MAASVNKVIIVGNLGKDPEARYLESGVCVVNFPVATSESYKDRNTGEKVTQTEWHNVVLWRGLAEVAEKYLQKGHQVYIEGKLKTRNWQDRDGNTRYTTEIVADNMVMMSKPSGTAGATADPAQEFAASPGQAQPAQPAQPTQGSGPMQPQAQSQAQPAADVSTAAPAQVEPAVASEPAQEYTNDSTNDDLPF